jgi:hypothetical protein
MIETPGNPSQIHPADDFSDMSQQLRLRFILKVLLSYIGVALPRMNAAQVRTLHLREEMLNGSHIVRLRTEEYYRDIRLLEEEPHDKALVIPSIV